MSAIQSILHTVDCINKIILLCAMEEKVKKKKIK